MKKLFVVLALLSTTTFAVEKLTSTDSFQSEQKASHTKQLSYADPATVDFKKFFNYIRYRDQVFNKTRKCRKAIYMIHDRNYDDISFDTYKVLPFKKAQLNMPPRGYHRAFYESQAC